SLNGKVAIVTGSARGMGLAIAKKFVAYGASVFLTDVLEQELEKATKALEVSYLGKVSSCVLDVSNLESVEHAIETCVRIFKGVDILVNNAGIVARGKIEDIDVALWNRLLSVNLTGVFLCSRAVIPYMKKRGGGVIINASSVNARLPDVDLSIYCISKAGVEVLTSVMGAELAPFNIRVVAYAPGVIETDMTKDIIKYRRDEKLAHIALRRFGKPEEVAELVAFLASDKASFITGVTIPINGGTMIVENPWKAWPDAFLGNNSGKMNLGGEKQWKK
ncbi:MAG: SDR family NAD(P)-dependent oxidoreductase, partial [Nitrososphaerota archaeon]